MREAVVPPPSILKIAARISVSGLALSSLSPAEMATAAGLYWKINRADISL
jgi:hypothetical protein